MAVGDEEDKFRFRLCRSDWIGWLVGCLYSLTRSLLGCCIYDFVGLQFSRFLEVELTKRYRTL
jgi:hypothetical protein